MHTSFRLFDEDGTSRSVVCLIGIAAPKFAAVGAGKLLHLPATATVNAWSIYRYTPSLQCFARGGDLCSTRQVTACEEICLRS